MRLTVDLSEKELKGLRLVGKGKPETIIRRMILEGIEIAQAKAEIAKPVKKPMTREQIDELVHDVRLCGCGWMSAGSSYTPRKPKSKKSAD